MGDKLETNVTLVSRPRISEWPAVPIDEALLRIEAAFDEDAMAKWRATKCVNVKAVKLGDVLADDIRARRPHPPFRASIKDGYAVKAADGAGRRRVLGTSVAGRSVAHKGIVVSEGNCCRINTGAPLPDGADAVVPVENTVLLEHNGIEELVIEITRAPKLGQDIREIGSDVALGERILPANRRIHPPDMGILALANITTVRVFEAATVSVLSTGDELVDDALDDLMTDGGRSSAIRDTNRPVLKSLFQLEGFHVEDLGIAPDSRHEMKAVIHRGLQISSVLVVSGGVSMGEKDYLKSVLADDFGFHIHFGRVMMKPGLPTTFATGTVGDRPKVVFGLPGNPVSAYVTAQLFVVPMLRKVGGVANYRHMKLFVRLTEDVCLDSRPEFRRAFLKQLDDSSNSADSAPIAECIAGSQMSSRLTSIGDASLLLQLPASRPPQAEWLKRGTPILALVIGPI